MDIFLFYLINGLNLFRKIEKYVFINCIRIMNIIRNGYLTLMKERFKIWKKIQTNYIVGTITNSWKLNSNSNPYEKLNNDKGLIGNKFKTHQPLKKKFYSIVKS